VAGFVPAGLLSATTNFVTTDLLSAPLLWIGPLGIYLLSFVVAFSSRGQPAVNLAERQAPAAAVLLWLPSISPVDWPAATILAVELGAFLVLAVVIHGRLARDRPDVTQLTGFYLVLSAGGMLATAFVALVAPVVFQDIYEYPLLVLAAILVLDLLPAPGAARLEWRVVPLLRQAGGRLVPFAVAVVVLVILVAVANPAKLNATLGLFAAGALVLAIGFRPSVLAGASLAVILLLATAERTGLILEQRTFFGVLRIRADETARAEFSGTTLHGFQFLDAARQQLPTTYYVADGPLGQLIQDGRDRTPSLRIGVVGLGVGTTASYGRPGDEITFFEIDPAAVRIAQDRAYFTYLADARVQPRIVLGDARLSLAQEPAGSFDLLVLDAFSSDAVPSHLLTREAVADYFRTLRPGGVLAFHVTNRFYHLDAAVVATAQSAGLGALVKRYAPTQDAIVERAATASVWVVAGTRTEMPRYRGLGWGDTSPGPVLTDDFADLLRVFRLLD
jgi:SAM-dependent methyltransferase